MQNGLHANAGPSPEDTTVIATSVPKAARMVGLSKSTLWPLVTSGQIPSILIGKRRLVLVEDIKAFLKSRQTA